MKKIFAGAAFLLQMISAHAVDSVSAELGGGSRKVNLWRVGAQWHQHPEWLTASHWSLYWDASLGSWHGDTGTVHDFGLTPVFRHAVAPRGAYFDAGIGFHVLSDSHVSSDLGFSTRFQFGDHLGIGYRFAHHYDLAVRFEHLSNGGMRNPNPGINFLQLRLRYHLN
jgi:lipid A 3-O-deacylase